MSAANFTPRSRSTTQSPELQMLRSVLIGFLLALPLLLCLPVLGSVYRVAVAAWPSGEAVQAPAAAGESRRVLGAHWTLASLGELASQPPEARLAAAAAPEAKSLQVLEKAALAVIDACGTLFVALFHTAVVLVVGYGIAMLLCARLRRPRVLHGGVPSGGWPHVSVLVPAYNEEQVVCKTVESLLASRYDGPLEIIVIDDGSRDATLAVATRAFAGHPQVRVLTKPNAGKANALNFGLAAAQGTIIAAIDADTVLHPDALRHLAVPFGDSRVGAVSGNMRVGNVINELTRQQAVEYVAANNLERRAHEFLDCITVVPGAIGAYRRSVLAALGGYHDDTLAEDADLTIRILRRGHRVVYEERAIALTEAPHEMNGFCKQRFRWSFGKLQVLWKHRDALLSMRCASLGWIGLPMMAVYQFMLPTFMFVVDLMMLSLVLALGLAAAGHGDLALMMLPSARLDVLLIELAALNVVSRLSTHLSAFHEGRCACHSPTSMIFHRWMVRWSLTLTTYRSLVHALRGTDCGWNKLQRSASVTADFDAEAA